MCFLTYSDSFYRDEAAGFLERRLDAAVRVFIDREVRIGTEDLFERLSADPHRGPVQLMGLEHWPEGLDNLLTRLNHRREALAKRCARPLLFWVLSRDLGAVATGAADLWAWRSGVFDFTLPALPRTGALHRSRIGQEMADTPRRRARMEELQKYLAARSSLRPIDVDLLVELGDLRRSLGEVVEAEDAYSRAQDALSNMDDRRRQAITRGRIADLLEARGQPGEALGIYERHVLPDVEAIGNPVEVEHVRDRIDSLRSLLAGSASR